MHEALESLPDPQEAPEDPLAVLNAIEIDMDLFSVAFSYEPKKAWQIYDFNLVVSTPTAPSTADLTLLNPLFNEGTMDAFFKRHFRKKAAPPPSETFCPPALRRCNVVITTGKARRRSSVGLASSSLSMQRRCSITQTQPLPIALVTSGRGGRREGRRRSSTTTPSLSPRFAVQRRRGGKLQSIDHQLLGPSMLLASLVPIKKAAEVREEESAEEEDEEGEDMSEEGTDQESIISSTSNHKSSEELCELPSCSTTDHRKLYAGD
ncbi:uncharacterized protein ACMZJ9_017272 [Mantella aurantiaca]